MQALSPHGMTREDTRIVRPIHPFPSLINGCIDLRESVRFDHVGEPGESVCSHKLFRTVHDRMDSPAHSISSRVPQTAQDRAFGGRVSFVPYLGDFASQPRPPNATPKQKFK
jgi:hypothetical protein